MVMLRDQDAERSHSITIGNSSFERMEQFKYLRKTWTYQNSIQEEIKSRVNSENASYKPVHNLESSSLLQENINIKIYRIIILPLVLYGSETWSLTLCDERRLRVFRNSLLRRIFGPKRYEITGKWRTLYNEELNLLVAELFFLILAQPVYKMWIIQEPNMLELWNKLHFLREKTEIIYHV